MRKNQMSEFNDTDLIVLCSALMRQHTWTVETANANGYSWEDEVQRVAELRTMVNAEFEARQRERGRIDRELALIEQIFGSDRNPDWY